MRLFLLLTLGLTTAFSAIAQAPVIEGDLMLCPDTNGTARITNDVTYTTYQWYSKYWFDNQAEFMPIDGATSSSFTYDWYTYDQMLLKVVVTQGEETLESNTIQIDSYAWASLLVSTTTSGNVTRGEYPIYLLCEGGTLTTTVLSPYTIAQWYRDDVAIEGATNVSYTITEPGSYYVVAGVDFCPNSTSTSLPITVQANTECATQDLTPVINGTNLLMCPDTTEQAFVANGLITYESYQWYSILNEEGAVFEPIEGATSDTFMYGWFNYDQRFLKLIVTEAGFTYESNVIQIDSYNWVSLTFTLDFNDGVTEGVTPEENQIYLLCPGGEITNTLPDLFSENIQWYRDGEPIEGANQQVYVISEPGSYHVQASPGMCPGSSNNTAGNPVLVGLNDDCAAGLDSQNANLVTLYPNPANNLLNVSLSATTGFQDYTIYDVTGKKLLTGKVAASFTSINVAGLKAGSYIVKLSGTNGNASKMFIKQ